MATTTFTNGVTLSDAGWFNDVDAVTYDGLTTQILVGGGAGTLAVWTAATGTGAPVRAGGPTFTGNVTFSAASAKVIPGATSLLFTNNADNATNLSISDAGLVTVRAGLTVTAGATTLTAGPLFVGATAASSVGGIAAVNGMNAATNNQWIKSFIHSTATTPWGLAVHYSGAAPNGTASAFLDCRDSSAQRAEIRSNGGIANFSANDVNLSTREVKNGYRVYTSDELLKYESFLEDVDFGIWKYNDQTHDDWNHGPTVEGVQAALKGCGLVAEECSLIGEFSDGRLGLYTHDFANIALASLVASNKRLRQRIEALESR